jgi:hypothetical protein
MGASHEDLRLRVQQLSRALTSTFFYDANAEQRTALPFSATSRFPERELFIFPDLSPVAPIKLKRRIGSAYPTGCRGFTLYRCLRGGTDYISTTIQQIYL